MNFDGLLNRLRNEPEWAVLVGLLVLLLGAGGTFFYFRYTQRVQSAQREFHQVLTVYSQSTRQGNYQRAVSTMERYLRDHPDAAQADKVHFFLGKLYFQQDQPIGAIKQFKQLLQTSPDSLFAPAARLHVGYANLRRGNPRQAINAFQAVIKEHSSHPLAKEARWQQALVLLGQGKNQQASTKLDQLISSTQETYWTDWARLLKNRFTAES